MANWRLVRPLNRRGFDLYGLKVERVWGRLAGEAGEKDGVVTPPSAETVSWEAGFELIQPADPAGRRAVVVEVENRGRPRCLGLFQGAEFPTVPPDDDRPRDLGSGFLFCQGFAYALIQWQYAFAEPPADGQGARLAILREFGRALRGGTLDPSLPPFERASLVGYSQGGRFIRSFLHEGFNAAPDDPEGLVYAGLLCMVAGAGYLPVNRLAAEQGIAPEADDPSGGDVPPYTWDGVLGPAAGQAKVIDVFTTSEYYNRRGSLVVDNPAGLPATVRHYDLAATTHLAYGTNGEAGLGTAEDLIWRPASEGGWNCNGGRRVPLNYVNTGPYLRAALMNLDRWVTAGIEPPPSAIHPLRPADPAELANPLPGIELKVPQTDDLGNPIGGISVADVEAPLGGFTPPWFTGEHRSSRMLGGFRPFSPDELARRYADRAAYLAGYGAALDRLVGERHVLAEDRETLLEQAAGHYDRVARQVPV